VYWRSEHLRVKHAHHVDPSEIDGASKHHSIHTSIGQIDVDTLRTRLGKPLNAEQTNPCPPWRVLTHSNACRVLDPERPDMCFFLSEDVGYEESWVSSMRKGYMWGENDVFLWFYEKHKKDNERPKGYIASNDPVDLTVVSPGSDGSELPATCKIIRTSESKPALYNKSRRSGWIIVRNLVTTTMKRTDFFPDDTDH
jgi:hypothetical protein